MIMKKIILTLVIFAFSLSIVSAQENAAKRALAEGDYQAAIKLYKVVIATSNDETQSANIYNEIKNAQKCDELLIQANEAYKKKKYSEAKKLYQSILKYNPSDKFSKKRVSLCSDNISQQNNATVQNNTKESKPSKSTENGHEYVDLGLSVMWATCNVGANKPEQYGNYYAWGETETKSRYTVVNSITQGMSISQLQSQGYIDGSGNLTSSHDAATANWGGSWRMPTKKEQQELIDKCTWQWTTQGGKKGYKVTGPNGNHIFLPAAGHRDLSSLFDAGNDGEYLNSTSYDGDIEFAYALEFNSGNHKVGISYRKNGLSVRPVCDKDIKTNNTTSQQNSTNAQSTTSQQNKSNTSTQNTTKVSKPSNGTANGHEYVDLGLSVMWATCNIGANKPEQYGNYYAWGETETKSVYKQNNSLTRGKKMNDISGNVDYDVARANWGGSWRMPTKTEFEELKNKCTWIPTTQNGVKGCKVVGPNGNYIFLPAGGSIVETSGNVARNAGRFGRFWSSTPCSTESAYHLCIDSQSRNGCSVLNNFGRPEGYSIRPVIK